MSKFLIILTAVIISSNAFHYEGSSARRGRQTSLMQQVNNKQKIYQSQQQISTNDLIARSILQMTQKIAIKSSNINQLTKYHVFSPIGIAGVLSLLLLGSKSKTHQELVSILGFDNILKSSENSFKIHEQFGFLINDLLKDSKKIQEKAFKRFSTSLSLPSNNLKKKYHSFRRSASGAFASSVKSPKSEISSKVNHHEIDIANGIFIQNGFTLKSDYKSSVESIYRSEIISLDFDKNAEIARKYINEWAQRKTNGKIEKIIAEGIQPRTNMIIASALYFKAFWKNSFIDNVTSKRKFYPEGKMKPSVLVDMMANGGEFPYFDAEEYGCRILGLPFKDDLSTMYIILPYDSNKEKLHKIQELLTANRIEEIISKMQRKSILVSLPKMHLESSMNLKEIFSQMGIKSLFNSEESDLSGIISEKSVPKKKSSINLKSRPIVNQPIIFGFEKKSKLVETPKAMMKNKDKETNIKDVLAQKKNKRAVNIREYIISKYLIKENNHDNSQKYNEITRKIFVDDIVHKVDLRINEQGTEGAATTVSYLSRSDFDEEFHVDSPFLFLIRHKATKLPIFYGSVYDPSI